MTRASKIAAWTCAGLLVAAALSVAVLFLMGMFTSDVVRSAREIPITKQYTDQMRTAGYPISVQRIFAASAYGGWLGDGSSVTAYRYPPYETEALLAALKKREPTYVWTDTSGGAGMIEPWPGLIPRDFLPTSDRSRLVVGSPADGLALLEYIVDPARGTLYSISNQF